ncbi:MAG: hypothetical protein ABIE36_01920 [Candidatus Diapherotrites archaeon]
MRDITDNLMRDITDNLKKAGIGLTILALTCLPLDAQKLSRKTHRFYSEKEKSLNSCFSKRAEKYNRNVYGESIGKPLFFSSDARGYKQKVEANNTPHDNRSVHKEEKRYIKHLRKMRRRK